MSEYELTDAQWRERLSAVQYLVMRNKGTEAPFSGRYVDTKDPGTYRCGGCAAALFHSRAKYDSKTGWPSFTEPLDGAVAFAEDHGRGMTRTEVLCARCGAHLGHVFDDGPAPGGQRYCINSVALDLEPEG